MFTKEDYVSAECAYLLREKGFDELCDAYYHLYDADEKADGANEDDSFEVTGDGSYSFRNSLNHYRVGAPTLYEAAKWLRERYQLHIEVGVYGDYSTDADGNKVDEWSYWCFTMYYYTNLRHPRRDSYGDFDSYESALNAGILEALKLINE